MSCVCHGCSSTYKVDIIIPDILWKKIKPISKFVEGGLLCGRCIFEKIEEQDNYDYWYLTKENI